MSEPSRPRRNPFVRRVARRLRGRSTAPVEWALAPRPFVRPPAQADWVTGAPDFVGVGAQRSGTSWWHALINEHPQVHVNPTMPKELHYFDSVLERPWNDESCRRYQALFPRPPGTIIGEWTPEYMARPWCAPLLAACGVEKLVVVLRDPVERYWAGWSFSVRRGAPAVTTIAGDAFARGLYHGQLSWILEHFDRAQLLVLQYERCLADTTSEIRRTYEFLGIDPTFVPLAPTALVKRVHPKPPFDPTLRRIITAAYRSDVEALAAAFPEIDPGLWANFSDDSSAAPAAGG